MQRILTALASGLIFGAGLATAGMLDPAKVTAFLDLAGAWDPSLALVMVGGITVNAVGYLMIGRRSKPAFAAAFAIPTRRDIDRPLVIGSLIFGIGWGMAGLCPGPVIANLALQPADAVPFFIVLMAGLWLGQRLTPILAR